MIHFVEDSPKIEDVDFPVIGDIYIYFSHIFIIQEDEVLGGLEITERHSVGGMQEWLLCGNDKSLITWVEGEEPYDSALFLLIPVDGKTVFVDVYKKKIAGVSPTPWELREEGCDWSPPHRRLRDE